MREKQLLIADGHHRYETSLTYKNKYLKNCNEPGPEDYVLMLFMDSSQEALKIYPTHRRLSFKKDINMEEIIKNLSVKYEISPEEIKNGDEADSMLEGFIVNNEIGFLFYLQEGSYILKLKNSHSFDAELENPDIFILHEESIKDLDDLLEIKGILLIMMVNV